MSDAAIPDTSKPSNCDYLLPSELWLRIFQLAGEEPRTFFNTSACLPMSIKDRSWSRDATISSESYIDYEKRLEIRLSLVRVCGRWNQMAKDILFEHVVLLRKHQVFAFSPAIEPRTVSTCNAGAVSDVSIYYPASFVKSLYVNFQAHRNNDNIFCDFPPLQPSFRLLKNLQILYMSSNMWTTGAEVIARDLMKLSPLRHLSWDCYRPLPWPGPEYCNRLEFLRLNRLQGYRFNRLSPISFSSPPHTRTY
jgi:hypothetical protein